MSVSRINVLRLAGAGIVLALLLAAIFLYALATIDIRAYTEHRRGILASVHEEQVSADPGSVRSLLTLQSSTGLTVHCAMDVPVSDAKLPAFILLGGKATGRDAVNYVEGIDSAIVIATDYLYTPRPSYSLTEVLADLPVLRSALLDMVPATVLVTDFLSAHPQVDTSRIVMVGYSFGAPFIPATMVVDERIDAGVMGYGGGEVASLIYHNVRLYKGELFSRVLGWAAAVLLRPIEPTRYAADVSPRPLLMVNGSEDSRIPKENVMALYDSANDPKELVWIPSQHVHPSNVELTRRIIHEMKVVLTAWGFLTSDRTP